MPGAVASSSYVALLWGAPHNLKLFVDANPGASTAAAALLVVAVGLLVESVGSYFEYYVVDSRHSDREAMLARWKEYLRIAWKAEPIGQHYLRRVLTIFKFELNLFVASIATIPGTLGLAWYRVVPEHGLVTIILITAGLATYLYFASVASSLLLDSLREQLIVQARASDALK